VTRQGKRMDARFREAQARSKPHEKNGVPKPAGNGDKPKQPPPIVETFSAADLLSMELPPPRWAVDGVLPEGLSILAGKPKLGKSWLALHLSMAIAAGGVGLGEIDLEGGDVLYIALEDTKRRLQSRLRRLMGPTETRETYARLTLAHAWPRMEAGGLDAIEEWLDAHPGARAVFIDTWARFKPFRLAKGEAYDLDYADGTMVKSVADHRGVALVTLHHCRKLGAVDPLEEVSGSVGLTGACDNILVLRRERGQQDATLHITGRDVDEAKLALRFARENCLWQIVGDAETVRCTKDRQAILDLLRSSKGMSPSEAAPLLGKTVNAVRKLLWRTAREGLLASRDGKYSIIEEPEEPDGRNHRPRHREEPGRNRDDTFKTPWG